MVWSLPVTHTDVQVLQEELQQTSTQAQCPHPLVAPRGLDPRAQVLGKMGVSHGCPGGQPRRQEPVHSGQVSGPARPPFQALGASRPHQGGSPQLQFTTVCWPGSHTWPPRWTQSKLGLQREGVFPGRETAWPPPAHPGVSLAPGDQKLTSGAPAGLCAPSG